MDAPLMITQPWDLRQQESPQPSSRLPSLLNFARLFLPIKYIFSYSKNRRSKLHAFSKISADVFSLLDFEMCLHSQLLNLLMRRSCLVGVDVSCSGYMEAWGPRRSLGLRPMANSNGRLTIQGYLCISHCCCLTHQLSRCDLR